MAYFRNVQLDANLTNPGFLPDGSILASQRTTLFDGKILNADDAEFWENVGTGTSTFSSNLVDMTVTSGKWVVSQTRRRMPYFSGKPQIVEMTFDNFDTQPNVVKRIGYFSSSAVSPYTASYDGFWIEDDGTTKYLKAANLGTETVSIPLSSWDARWATYDFSKFSVIQFYFLWLGGAALVAFGATAANGFQFQTAAQYVSSAEGMICSSPNQPLRYEIRSSTGSGNFRRICSQVSTAGSIGESGKALSLINSASVNCNVIGTTYVLKGIRKRTDRRDVSIKITEIGCVSTATADAGILMLLRNPTLSAPLTYSNNSNVQEATGTTETVSAFGRILKSVPCGQEGVASKLETDYLTWLSMSITNTLDEYVLAFLSLTSNQARAGEIQIIEYI